MCKDTRIFRIMQIVLWIFLCILLGFHYLLPNGKRRMHLENKRKTIFFFVFCSVFTTFAANLENREKNEEDLLFLRRCSDGADSVRG